MSCLSYFHSFKSSLNDFTCTYSIDKVILKGKFLFEQSQLFLNWLSEYDMVSRDSLPFGYKLFYLGYYTSTKIGSYFNSFDIQLSKDNSPVMCSSFFLGCNLNSSGRKLEHWKLEFNPNKILPCEFFSKLLDKLLFYTVPRSCVVASWDLAIDIPISRRSVALLKDKRMYTQIFKGSDDLTEYLGARHSHGFVKLYNKSLESDLDCTLTRFEITFNSLLSSACHGVVPVLYLLGDKQISIDYLSELSQNQRVFFELLLLQPYYINFLDKRGKAKYSKLLADNSVVFKFDWSAFDFFVSKLNNYTLGVVSCE